MSEDLCSAVWEEDIDLVVAFLNRGDDVNFPDGRIFDSTPLHQAGMKGNTSIARILIERGADIHAVNRDNQTPLAISISTDDRELIQLLIDSGANVNYRCGTGYIDTPLHAAAFYNNLIAAQILIDAGADLNTVACCGNTPVLIAAMKGYGEMVNFLVYQVQLQMCMSMQQWEIFKKFKITFN
jgi:ankyrin repeat protein